MDISNPASRVTTTRFLKEIFSYRDSDVTKFFNGIGAGKCINTNGLGAGSSLPQIDYIVFVPEIGEITPVVFGEEITHGEHCLFHGSNWCDYEMKFSQPSYEHVAFLGNMLIGEKTEMKMVSEEVLRLDSRSNIESEINHFMGYSSADQLAKKGTVPFRDIFHAENEKELWKTVNDIIIPRISIDSNGVRKRDELYRSVSGKAEDMGMRAIIDIS